MAKVNFTARRIQEHACPEGKEQAFLWDANSPGLGLRATANGAKSYIFQGKIHGRTVRLTIGSPRSWGIDQAQEEARRLQTLIDAGKDPREVKAEQRAAHEARLAAAAAHAVTVAEAWAAYLEDRQPYWGERHYTDHVSKAQAGGIPSVRGTRGRGVTIAGPLYPLMSMRLSGLDATTVEEWAVREGKKRPTSARLAWRLLKGFLTWCAEQPAYASAVMGNPAKTKKSREALGTAGVKQDALQREQLPGWFAGVRQLPNPIVSAYLQTLLLTGARPGEVLEMRWEDVNTKWNGLTIRDKVEGARTIPLTPYVSNLLAALPRRSEWVFSSSVSIPGRAPKPISKPHQMHDRACSIAGIDGLTLHGMRRSFKSLTEWLDCPAGVVAQIMGHKPSATAEKHYTVRPLDLLRVHHERIEAWVLQQAGIAFQPGLVKPYLTLVTAA
ncbi:integrase family protein [Cupriavidus oxalaticus]|uniref:tyrosine-type recombinase/integrase n=1 Tax=Cupriavidus oxalaticus TaxID=96344 RepID=UPI003181CB60